MATAAITGTITESVNESDIVAGGKTIVVTLSGDAWIAAGGGGPITYFGSASTPADNAAQAAPGPIAITPPSSMVAGDLVVVLVRTRGAYTLTNVNDGGQAWTALAAHPESSTSRIFWCRYDGTWDANPTFQSSGGTDSLSAIMHVFRPGSGSSTWAVDVAYTGTDSSAATNPVVATGINTLTNGALVIVTYETINGLATWGSLTSTWAAAGTAQYRNTTGGGQSVAFAYKVIPTAGATGDVSATKSNTYDVSYWGIMAFKEVP